MTFELQVPGPPVGSIPTGGQLAGDSALGSGTRGTLRKHRGCSSSGGGPVGTSREGLLAIRVLLLVATNHSNPIVSATNNANAVVS